MNKKQIILTLVLLDFLALQAWVVADVGYLGVFEHAVSSPPAIVLSVDLVIALLLVSIWMLLDAKERDIPIVPYLVLTLGLGSTGPLAYLIHREVRRRGEADARQRRTVVSG